MKVKGTILSSTHNYIKTNHPGRYQEWFNLLPDASRKIYNQTILASEWYDYTYGLIEPTKVLAHLIFDDKLEKAGWELGRYSAEVGLKGIYKVFILIATPQFIMKRGGKILASFYDPAELIISEERPKGVDIHLPLFPESTVITENRIGGWMEKALEICGVRNITINITKSIAAGDAMTIYVVNWE